MPFFSDFPTHSVCNHNRNSAAPMSAQLTQRMPSKQDFFSSFSYEKEIERAKWYRDDLDKGGWKEVHRSPGHVYWIKTFPEDEVPTKVLSFVDLPISAETYRELVDPKNLDKRKKVG